MISRPDLRVWLAAAAIFAFVPAALAAPERDGLADAREALSRRDGRTAGRGFHALGRLEMAEGDLAAAARAFDRALAEDSGDSALWVDIGRMRYLSGQHGLAKSAAARALAIDPGEPQALLFQGQLVRDSKGVIAALPWFERALERAPDDIDLLGEYAATLGEAGRNRDMLRIARRMVEFDPSHPRAYFLQAVLAARAGEDDLARRLLWRTEGAYDSVPAGQLLAGILELRTGNPALAAEKFAKLAERQPDNLTVAQLLARALLASGEAAEVVARFGLMVARADASPYLLTVVGRAHEQLGQREEAARYLDRAGATLPVGMLAMSSRSHGRMRVASQASEAVRLLRELLGKGRDEEARARSLRLVETFPDSGDVARVSGDVLLFAGWPAGAVAQFSRAAEIRSDMALVRRRVAAAQAMGADASARRIAAEHLARNPRDAAAAALLGRMLGMEGDWNRAAALLAHARLMGGAHDPRLLADLAAAQLMAGDPRGADATARRARLLQPANARVADVLERVPGGPEHPRLAQAAMAKTRHLAAGGSALAMR